MVRSRLRSYQDKKERQQIVLTLGGIFALIAFLALFGVKILVGFSLFVDKLRGGSPKQEQTVDIVLPPVLDPIPEFTANDTIEIKGKAKGKVTILLFVNDGKSDELTLTDTETFSFPKVSLTEGENTISAKSEDEKGTTSALSNILTITLKKSKPTLEIASPSDNAEIHGDKAVVAVVGKTDPDNTVTVNGRFVVVKSDGSFTYDFLLADGEQTMTILAKDSAGNETKVERKVKYSK